MFALRPEQQKSQHQPASEPPPASTNLLQPPLTNSSLHQPPSTSSNLLRRRRLSSPSRTSLELRVRKSRVSFSCSLESMSICEMQLDPAAPPSPPSPSPSPDLPEQHETQTSLSGSCAIWPQKTCLERLEKEPFFPGRSVAQLPEPELTGCPCAGEGADLRLAELEMRAAALCLPTASLQRWKCETLIDHLSRSLLCGDRSYWLTKRSLVLLKNKTCLNFNQVLDAHAPAARLHRWRQRSLSAPTSCK